ncbi:MAG: DUF2508 family protein [Clostridiaceae bacterium]|nr:DUF2508 family protein [Clostridiaceae bacterium]
MELNTDKNQIIKAYYKNRFSKMLGFIKLKEKSGLTTAEEINEMENLIECIRNARSEWLNAITNFEYVAENGLVDYYTYSIKAYQVRYEYLLKKAKEKGISIKHM